MDIVKEVVRVIKSILPNRRPLEHHEPFIDIYQVKEAILDAVDHGITGYTSIVHFENYIKDITKADYVVLTSSGSSALELALKALAIQPGSNVLIPTSTFVATANSVKHAGSFPVFLDGIMIDPIKLRSILKGNKLDISAVIVVHLFGLPADMDGICRVAKEFNIKVIEDASQALGSYIDDKACGTFGDAGILSFNNNKIITTNGGGALLSNDSELAYRAHRLATTARVPHKWLIGHDEIAHNYRMGNINAALGCSQIQNFPRILAEKRALAVRYRHNLDQLVEFVESPVKSEPNYWLNTILVECRDDLLNALHNESIRARAVFTPLHKLSMYEHYIRSDEVMYEADELFRKGVCLPSGSGLSR